MTYLFSSRELNLLNFSDFFYAYCFLFQFSFYLFIFKLFIYFFILFIYFQCFCIPFQEHGMTVSIPKNYMPIVTEARRDYLVDRKFSEVNRSSFFRSYFFSFVCFFLSFFLCLVVMH